MDGILGRLWMNLVGRIGGPLTFRLVLQPTTAAVFALRAGWKDARQGRVPYGWKLLSDPIERRDLLQEAWKDVAKVFVAAVIIDLIYQIIELSWFYPEEAVIVATILALMPYLLLRGPAHRMARRWQHVEELK